MIVLLDAGPLGLLVHTNADNPEVSACSLWLERLVDAQVQVCIPEVVDYEVRRKLLHLNSRKSLRRLDQLKELTLFLPINSAVMLRAAECWATARSQGIVTALPEGLDADMILVAQATVGLPSDGSVVVATTNAKHIGSFVEAKKWRDINAA